MAKVTLNSLGSNYELKEAYNHNNELIEEGFDNTLSRDGSNPNHMLANLDMNGYRIVNLSAAVNGSEPITLAQLPTLLAANMIDLTGYEAVLTTGDQGISGIKTFNNAIGMQDLLWGRWLPRYALLQSNDSDRVGIGFNTGLPASVGILSFAIDDGLKAGFLNTGEQWRFRVDLNTGVIDEGILPSPQVATSTSVFTPTVWEGFFDAPDGVFHYFRMGDMVHMRWEGTAVGLSNSGGPALGTLPLELRPASARQITLPVFIQTTGFGNQRAIYQAEIQPDGIIRFFNPIVFLDVVDVVRHMQSHPSNKSWYIAEGASFWYQL